MKYLQWVALLSLTAAVSAHSQEPSRSWDFNLTAPGTYKVQVEHDVGTTVPSGTQVTYSITVGKETQSRILALVADRPYIPLVMDAPGPEKMHVVVTGLPAAALKHTHVYVYDANTQYPGEYYDPSKGADFGDARRVRAILRRVDDRTDLATAKLMIDKMVDSTVDVAATLKKIDAMVAGIQAMPEYGPSSDAKLNALQRYVYEPGHWNSQQPFRYDLDDPLGREIQHKLLSSYLATKKGNCVSMPLLFIILGQRLGLDVTLSTAPTHFLVKFKSDEYGWINLEATSGAKPARDVWLRQQFPMTDAALANGLYLKPLTRRETVAEMAVVVDEHYFNQKEYEKALAVADVVLEYYPKDVGTMAMEGTAYGRIARERMASAHLSPSSISDSFRGYFGYLQQNNQRWFAKAEALGWRAESSDDKQQYLQGVNQAKQRESQH